MPGEPPHIHVRHGRDEAKFWLSPEVRVAYNDGFDARTLAERLGVTEMRKAEFERTWHDDFR
jgi:hypothetical protein